MVAHIFSLLLMVGVGLLNSAYALTPTHALIKDRSTLTFTSNVNGKTVEGTFTDYNATIAFDPARPQDGSITVTVKIAPHTVKLSDPRAADSLLGAELMAMRNLGIFIPATFQSTEIEALSEQDFRGRGILTVMGRKQVVNYQFLLVDYASGLIDPNDKQTVTFTTYFDINRQGYGKFKGEKAAGYTIGDKVTIAANLVTRKLNAPARTSLSTP